MLLLHKTLLKTEMRIAILIVKNIKEYGIDKFDIKNWTYYYFDDMININDFNPETSK